MRNDIPLSQTLTLSMHPTNSPYNFIAHIIQGRHEIDDGSKKTSMKVEGTLKSETCNKCGHTAQGFDG